MNDLWKRRKVWDLNQKDSEETFHAFKRYPVEATNSTNQSHAVHKQKRDRDVQVTKLIQNFTLSNTLSLFILFHLGWTDYNLLSR